MTMFKTLLLAAIGALAASSALATPVLRSDVTVIAEIVTVGDMFDNAGSLAEQALFRAPKPGTAGIVSLDAIAQAAAKVGLTDYDREGVARVRVARSAAIIDGAMLRDLIAGDLTARGIVAADVDVECAFDTPDIAFNAEAVADPIQLVSLRYVPQNGGFVARFQIAGVELPVDVTGTISLMVAAPHLAATLAAGTVLGPNDIEMKKVPLKFAESSGIGTIEQLVGKQLVRNARAGLMLRASDVTEPQVVERNAFVTVYFRTGTMTLTVKGQALNSASAGEPVQVMNSVTKKLLHGVAMANGAVEITAAALTIAGL